MKFGRNLTASEILDQALHFRRMDDGRPRRLHGHGRADDEPRQRARGVRSACPTSASPTAARRSRPWAGSRASTRSPRSRLPIRLALSLHAADDALRSRDHARQRPLPAGRRARRLPALLRAPSAGMVFVEYVMLGGVNDRYEQAVALAARPRPADVQGQPDPLQPDRHVRRLEPRGDRRVQGRARGARASSATVRLTRGRDIDAACGQLAAKR